MTADSTAPLQTHFSLPWAIARQICDAPHQRIPFATFMEMALYHPAGGYYNRQSNGRSPIGAKGDFVTAPHMGADFGELLAEQFVDMWNRLGRPYPFHVVEMGAGQGLIVRDVLSYLHRHHFDCFEALNYLIVEQSKALIAEQKRQLAVLPSLAEAQARLQWCQWHEIPPESITGCFFSNELVDAFPVHRVTVADGALQEVYVTLQQLEMIQALMDKESNQPQRSTSKPAEQESACEKNAALQEVELRFTETLDSPSTPQLQDYFARLGIDLCGGLYPDGYCTEVNLQALDWLHTVAQRLRRGYVLTIDYGYPAHRFYNPTRSQGTLQCYYQHAHHSNPYVHVGQQDITAHVDFTSLQRQGERLGLQTLGLTQQALFLMALGLGDRIAALSDAPVEPPATGDAADPNSQRKSQSPPSPQLTMNDLLRRREALHALMNPMGMGNFQVLLQGRGLAPEAQAQPLKGFDIPPFPA